MKIALDHDSTIASTGTIAFDLIGSDAEGCTYDDIESWEWGLEKFGAERFLSAMWHAWTLRPLEVPLMDDTVVETVEELYEEHEIHIVTAHPDQMGIEEGKKAWLEYHSIPYDEFHVVPTDTTKAVLDYDVYIDDKPYLPLRVNEVNSSKQVFVRHHQYNKDVPGDYTRIYQLSEVLPHVKSENSSTNRQWNSAD